MRVVGVVLDRTNLVILVDHDSRWHRQVPTAAAIELIQIDSQVQIDLLEVFVKPMHQVQLLGILVFRIVQDFEFESVFVDQFPTMVGQLGRNRNEPRPDVF